MLHGRAVRPPRYGAKLESFDEAAVRAMPGIVAIVRDGSFLGVVAEREEQAIKARAVLSDGAQWSGGTELPDPDKVYDHLLSLRSADTVTNAKRASPPPSDAPVVMKAQGAVADGRILDWQYELWSGPHGVRPGAPDGSNLFASWSLAQPQKRPLARNIPLPAGGGDRNAIPGYDLPNHRIVNHFIPDMPIWVSSLRTLGGYANVFAIESFMEELAFAAGVDTGA